MTKKTMLGLNRMFQSPDAFSCQLWEIMSVLDSGISGILPLDARSRLALLQILEERYDRKPMIIISQLAIFKWYDCIAEPTSAETCQQYHASGTKRRGDET